MIIKTKVLIKPNNCGKCCSKCVHKEECDKWCLTVDIIRCKDCVYYKE